ncbi:ACP S-malonyltransferase [Psychrobacillus psychrodurans]|jgi:[acyl-carrier-protein] S-malonyltransferase|uniref:ACP S-malonyltransferase n=1 Tax=Psychrobacillus psychrodurans TaxID=126157 RepID=UPI0008DFEF9C|nr:ACP S-malonyltransferase [Psychrobacillus psychrodurans]MCZ8539502.1 ACP S-malonyltransferase [Psychrobacillus psychrodurans]SFM40384.1 [acyl-carrier-protein] S-malonyltransferase [Psychrobacillus psychrodurans]
MTKIAFIFPGQGSQSVGMGQQLVENNEECRTFYERANEVLGFSLSELMLHGPAEDLTKTYNAQPALLTASSMVAYKLKQAGIIPHFTAGHSLGEYSALVASNVLSFEEAVLLVHQRGLYMNEAVPAGEGAMAAILGLGREELSAVTDFVSANGEVVQIANLNCPGQIVISGTASGVELASSKAKEAGAKRAIPLVVSGPFHSELMRPAAEQLDAAISAVELRQASIPVISNVTAEPVTDASHIKNLLVEQLYSPVRWEESIRQMIALGTTVFVECGPGKVLSGLVKKIDRSVTTYCVYDEVTLQQVITELGDAQNG